MNYKHVGRANFINSKQNDLSAYYNTKKESQLFGEDYFQLLNKKFDAFKYYMQRRNDELQAKINRKGVFSSPGKNPINGLIKENLNEIAQLSQPFREMFDSAVEQVSIF